MAYKEIKGDLIRLALEDTFEVIAHGTNCYCIQNAGLALSMKATFKTDTFKLEGGYAKGDYNKLGQIDYQRVGICDGKVTTSYSLEFTETNSEMKSLYVVNCYTQYGPGVPGRYGIPLDYDALRLCLAKINHRFRGMKIGLPQIGCHLAGGTWDKVSEIIKKELVGCDVTVVIWDKP